MRGRRGIWEKFWPSQSQRNNGTLVKNQKNQIWTHTKSQSPGEGITSTWVYVRSLGLTMAESGQLSGPGSDVYSGAESSEAEGMGSPSSSVFDSQGFSTDVSDRAGARAQNLCSLTVWEPDCSTDVSDNRQRKGRRVLQSSLC